MISRVGLFSDYHGPSLLWVRGFAGSGYHGPPQSWVREFGLSWSLTVVGSRVRAVMVPHSRGFVSSDCHGPSQLWVHGFGLSWSPTVGGRVDGFRSCPSL